MYSIPIFHKKINSYNIYIYRPFIEFPMVALRRVSAILGTSLVPLSYLTMRNLGHSRSTATMAAALIMIGKKDIFFKQK